MKEVNVSEKILIRVFEYEDREEFREMYVKEDKNYAALYMIFKEGMKVYIVNRKWWKFDFTMGFASIIDCAFLTNEDNYLRVEFKIPMQYDELFINDFRIKKPFRKKGYGTALARYVLQQKRKFLLLPEEDGGYFWPKMGFKYDRRRYLMMLDNRDID